MAQTAAIPSAPSSPTSQTSSFPGWGPLVVIASAHLMAILDTTIMFVALPSAQRALHLSVTSRQWVVTGYTLAFGALLLLGGRLADRFGARRTLMVGVIGFACASAIGGASVDGTMLITARVVQGAFGALLVSSTKSLLINVYSDGAQRAKVIGIFTATLTAGMALGLVLGGLLTSGLDWRWCLYVNLALCLVTVVGAPRLLPSLPARPEVRIDIASAALASLGMVGLIYGLAEVPSDGWASATVVASLVAAAVLLGTFVVRQLDVASPLLPIRVIRDRNRGGALVAMIVNGLSTVGMMLILTFQLQSVMHYTALRTGLALVPFALFAAVGSAGLGPRLMPRVPARWLVAAGLLLSASGLAILVGLAPGSHYFPLIFVAEIVEGIGTGIGGPAILQTTLRGVLPADSGAGSAASSAAGQLGSSIGTALLNTIAATTTAGYLATHAGASQVSATVHGYATAMGWGAAILLVAAVPLIFVINAGTPAKR
jgi:EmrB/QacA subfamily drug resistance transporter